MMILVNHEPMVFIYQNKKQEENSNILLMVNLRGNRQTPDYNKAF